MFVHRTRLPHLLAPADYHASAPHERELARVFRPRWHCVATQGELPGHGDFVTRELLGVPLLLRRTAAGLTALRNVCAHRHSLLTDRPSGRMATLRCQYHGWAYDDAGRLAYVPDESSFTAPAGKLPLIGRVALRPYAVTTLGQLVFVSLHPDPPPLRVSLGARTHDLAEQLFGDDFEQVMARELDHPCNWKVPLENVLETYHVPELHRSWLARHPRLLPIFGGPAAETAHELGDGWTEYRDAMGAGFPPYRALVRLLAGDVPCAYRHHHGFPNVVIGQTPVLGFLQTVTPTGPRSCRSSVRLFLRRGARRTAPLRKLAAAVARRFLDMVLRQDAAVYTSVQRGLQASDGGGVLGAREERVWAFQRWLVDALGDG